MSRGRSSYVFLGFAAMATMACPLAAGCMVGENDEMVSSDGMDVPLAALTGTSDPDDPPVGHNPMFPVCFWNHGTQQTYRDLANGALANLQGELPNMPYLGQGLHFTIKSTCREQSLRYLVKCALSEGTTLTDPYNGATYQGHHGIATEWRSGPLKLANKEWITSCLLQHLNGYYTTTALLLEGNRSGFTINTVPSGYPEFDSIMWGDLFSSTTVLNPTGWNPATSTPAFRASGCYFQDLVADCYSAPEALETKTCSGISCVNVIGQCETECEWNTSNGAYSPTAYWTCGGKTKSFRERLPSLDMYGTDCEIVY